MATIQLDIELSREMKYLHDLKSGVVVAESFTAHTLNVTSHNIHETI